MSEKCEGFAAQPNRQLEYTFDRVEYLSFRSVQEKRSFHDGFRRGSGESGEKEEGPSFVLDLTECPPALCLSSRAYKVKLVSVLCREELDPKTIEERVSSLTDFLKVTKST